MVKAWRWHRIQMCVYGLFDTIKPSPPILLILIWNITMGSRKLGQSIYDTVADCSTCTTIENGQTMENIIQWYYYCTYPDDDKRQRYICDVNGCLQCTIYFSILVFSVKKVKKLSTTPLSRRKLTQNIRIIIIIRRQREREGTWVKDRAKTDSCNK